MVQVDRFNDWHGMNRVGDCVAKARPTHGNGHPLRLVYEFSWRKSVGTNILSFRRPRQRKSITRHVMRVSEVRAVSAIFL